jgi:hypothetical protein
MVLDALERMHAHLTAAVVSNDVLFLQARLENIFASHPTPLPIVNLLLKFNVSLNDKSNYSLSVGLLTTCISRKLLAKR